MSNITMDTRYLLPEEVVTLLQCGFSNLREGSRFVRHFKDEPKEGDPVLERMAELADAMYFLTGVFLRGDRNQLVRSLPEIKLYLGILTKMTDNPTDHAPCANYRLISEQVLEQLSAQFAIDGSYGDVGHNNGNAARA